MKNFLTIPLAALFLSTPSHVAETAEQEHLPILGMAFTTPNGKPSCCSQEYSRSEYTLDQSGSFHKVGESTVHSHNSDTSEEPEEFGEIFKLDICFAGGETNWQEILNLPSTDEHAQRLSVSVIDYTHASTKTKSETRKFSFSMTYRYRAMSLDKKTKTYITNLLEDLYADLETRIDNKEIIDGTCYFSNERSHDSIRHNVFGDGAPKHKVVFAASQHCNIDDESLRTFFMTEFCKRIGNGNSFKELLSQYLTPKNPIIVKD